MEDKKSNYVEELIYLLNKGITDNPLYLAQIEIENSRFKKTKDITDKL